MFVQFLRKCPPSLEEFQAMISKRKYNPKDYKIFVFEYFHGDWFEIGKLFLLIIKIGEQEDFEMVVLRNPSPRFYVLGKESSTTALEYFFRL